MNQIHTALERLFNKEGQRIVFWNDPDREFQMILSMLGIDGVTTLRLDEVGALEAKYRLEREEPTGKFLLYAPTEEPDYEDDWLLDIRLYSRSFRADRASILLQELGLVNQQQLRTAYRRPAEVLRRQGTPPEAEVARRPRRRRWRPRPEDDRRRGPGRPARTV